MYELLGIVFKIILNFKRYFVFCKFNIIFNNLKILLVNLILIEMNFGRDLGMFLIKKMKFGI